MAPVEDVFGIVGSIQAANFRVERVVAEGGFGVVYRAEHIGFRAPVALKCLKIPEEMTQQQREVFLQKFREEAQILFRLSAAIPEVVRPLHIDVLRLPSGVFVPFLAMEWLDGESLGAMITLRKRQGKPPLALPRLVQMLRPIAQALARAHHFLGHRGSESIVHRDLKPENLLVATIGGGEVVKILDFGIAKAKRVASQAAGRITGRLDPDDEEDGSFTPAYGAPEQWAPKRFGATGPWTDVWGLALTMVEALVGRPPIDGDTFTMRRIALDERRRPTPRVLGIDVDPAVDHVFERALAVDPRDRIREMEVFWSELERAVEPLGRDPRSSLRSQDFGSPMSGPPSGLEFDLPRIPSPLASSDWIPQSDRSGTEAAVSSSRRELETGERRSLDRISADRISAEPVASPRMAQSPPSSKKRVGVEPDTPSSLRRESPLENIPAPGENAFELDAPRPSRPSGLVRPSRASPSPHGTSPDAPKKSEMSDLRERLAGPLSVMALALAIALAVIAYNRATGAPLMLGPVRAFWIAATLSVFGVAFTLWRLMGDRDDD